MDWSGSLFNNALARFPDLAEIVRWAILLPVLIIAIFFGRLVLRGLVNRRVRSIERIGMDFGSLDRMKGGGLISEQEYRLLRKKMAERHLEEVKAEKDAAKAGQVLQAIEADPALAPRLLPPSSERARQALADLGRKPREGSSPGPANPPAPEPPSSSAGSCQGSALPGAQEGLAGGTGGGFVDETSAFGAPIWFAGGGEGREANRHPARDVPIGRPDARSAARASLATPTAQPGPPKQLPTAPDRSRAKPPEGRAPSAQRLAEIEALHAQGKITDEERERLRRYFEAQSRGAP